MEWDARHDARTKPRSDQGQAPWALVSRRVVTPIGNPRGRGVDRGRDDRRRDRTGRQCRQRIASTTWAIGSYCPAWSILMCTSTSRAGPSGRGSRTATRAAAAGGITTLVDMPLNSSPVTTTAEALAQKLEAARGKLWVDCGFYGGVVPGASGHVGPLVAAGVLGFKAFLCHSGIDEFPNATEADLRAVMPELARAGRAPAGARRADRRPAARGSGHGRSRAGATRGISRRDRASGSTPRSGS